MEKTVKITSIEEGKGKKSGKTHWKLHTSPALVPDKLIFINKEEQKNEFSVGKSYNFDFFVNDAGYIQINSFIEAIDQNQDMIDEEEPPTPAPKGDSRTNSILLQVGGKLAVQEVKVHNLDTMTNAEIHAYAQSLARSWFTMLKEEGK